MPVPELAGVTAAIDLLGPVAGTAATSVVYRLLHVELARQRGVDVPLPEALDGLDLDPGVPADLLREAVAGLRADGPPSAADVRGLGDLHQALLPRADRRAAGAYFTPQRLIDHLLDEALEPLLDARDPHDVTVCDPSCGSGLFLAAAAARLVRRGVPVDHAVRHCLHGHDLDAAAVELARVSLWLTGLDLGGSRTVRGVHLHAGDALLEAAAPGPFDLVVGNPPFLNRLERRTAPDVQEGRRLARESGGAVRAYTDVSAVFLHRAVSRVRRGGRVALVQPQSLLAARDAGGVRADLVRDCSLESLWSSDRPVFDAGVIACAPVLRRGGEQGQVRRSHGAGCDPLPPVDAGDLGGTWSHLVADVLGLPRVQLATSAGARRVLSDVADCTADFRDQYYGLRGRVQEAQDCPTGAPLVTTGVIDPAVCRWGVRQTRVHKRRWTAPVVDVASLDDGLQRWARARLVPKVLVATQGRVLEAVVDEHGGWLPSVPTLTVVPRRTTLWHVLALLLAPPVAVHAATTYAGSGLTLQAVKLSARQVGALPLPLDQEGWSRAATDVRRAQLEPGRRLAHLESAGRRMCTAYGVPPTGALAWWLERLR